MNKRLRRKRWIRDIKDRFEAILDFVRDKKNTRTLLYAASGMAVIAVVVGIAVASPLSNSTKVASASVAEESTSVEEVPEIVALSPDGALFPSLEVDIPTTEAPPEYLKLGVEHPFVAEIQQRLMDLGFMDNDEPTEYFGTVTESAVKVFQRQNDLDTDGIIGPDTLPLLMAEDAKYYAAKEGDSGDDITRIQTRLYELGYLASSDLITGNFGEKTYEAVVKLQQINGLASTDGKVGRETTNLIYSDEVKANVLSYGEKSEVVEAIQKRLFSLGYLTTTPDGTYGNDTAVAVKLFQTKNALVVDGYLGPSTRAAILSSSAIPNGLTLGDSSDQVTNVQKLLAKWGYLSSSNITGYFGEATDAAVKAFQSRNGLSVDGSVGAKTIAKLTADSVVRPSTSGSSSAGSSSGSSGSSGSSSGSSNNSALYSGGGSVGNMLAVAASKIGSPYVWGAKGPNSFDCSGFVYWVLNNSGVRQSYMTSSGWRNAGKFTRISSFSQLQAGDIIVVSGHVGICAGGGQVIDASSSNGRVVRRSLSSWWQRNFIVGWRIF